MSSTVGNYAVASRVASILGLFSGSLIVMLPFFSNMLAKDASKEEMSNVLSYVLYVIFVFSSPFIILFFMFSHAIMLSVFPSYTSVYLYIALMSISIFLSMIGSPSSSLVVSRGKVKTVLIFSSIIGISELAFMFLLIPKFGAYGAIASLYFIGVAISDFLYIRETVKYGIRIKASRIYRVVIADIALALVFLPLLLSSIYTTTKLVLSIAVLFVSYPPLLALVKGVSKDDAERIKRLTKGLPIVGKFIGALAEYAKIVAVYLYG